MAQAQVKLYTSQNALVLITFDTQEALTDLEARNIALSIETLVKGGLSPVELKAEQLEEKTEVLFVGRRIANDNETPIIDFYSAHPKVTHRVFFNYLNNQEDIQAFENYAGISLSDLPEYDSPTPLERDTQKSQKYLVKLPAPLKIVFKINPKWVKWSEGDKTGEEPRKRLFVRYEKVDTPQASSPPPAPRPKKMNFQQAVEILTPGGTQIGKLTDTQLRQLAGSNATNVTDEMKEAARVVIESFTQS